MKEFIMKHPILSFLIADAVIQGIVTLEKNILNTILACKGIDPNDSRTAVKVKAETVQDSEDFEDSEETEEEE